VARAGPPRAGPVSGGLGAAGGGQQGGLRPDRLDLLTARAA